MVNDAADKTEEVEAQKDGKWRGPSREIEGTQGSEEKPSSDAAAQERGDAEVRRRKGEQARRSNQ